MLGSRGERGSSVTASDGTGPLPQSLESGKTGDYTRLSRGSFIGFFTLALSSGNDPPLGAS
jgi:hypothetical protein